MLRGGHKTVTRVEFTYYSVISIGTVIVSLNVAALYDLKVLYCDTTNPYLTENFREIIWTIDGP